MADKIHLSSTPGTYDFLNSIPTSAPSPVPTDGGWNHREPPNGPSPNQSSTVYQMTPTVATNHFSLDYTVILAIFIICVTLVLIAFIIKKK